MCKRRYEKISEIQNDLKRLLKYFGITPYELDENSKYVVSYKDMDIYVGNGLETENYLNLIGEEMRKKVVVQLQTPAEA